MKVSLVNDALLIAIWQRKPERGLLWHSDRGSQYASDSHREILIEHGITQSISRKGNSWDNAVAEKYIHTFKVELIHQYRLKRENKLIRQFLIILKSFIIDSVFTQPMNTGRR